MVKALFLDFYGTVVRDDGLLIQKFIEEIYRGGNAKRISEVESFLWKQFRTRCTAARGKDFVPQREIERAGLYETMVQFQAEADIDRYCREIFQYWRKPELFPESREFFRRISIPVFIVSNIDTNDLRCALEYHDLQPSGIFTSEEAGAYKPNGKLFFDALCQTGLSADEVIHVGDSLGSDVRGAQSAGIRALWLNRSAKDVPEGITAVEELLQVLRFME